MTRQDFIDYLQAHGCEIVRIANQGYYVMRRGNEMSGVPVTDPPLAATACRICKTLGVPVPDAAIDAASTIEEIHNKFNGQNH